LALKKLKLKDGSKRLSGIEFHRVRPAVEARRTQMLRR